MHHPRYCLKHHPGIFSNITNATHFRKSPMPPMLAHCSLYPYWRTPQAGTSPQRAAYVTHASMSTTLAHHSRQQATKANTPPTLARLPRMRATHSTHTSTNSTPFLELTRKHLVFIFTAFTFQAFLSIFIEVWKTAIEKLNFFRRNQSALL